MSTQKDELVEKTKRKIIDLFGPESALAQAMEDDDFFDKLAELICWLYGEIMLSQPKPQPPRYRSPWEEHKWRAVPADKWRTSVTAPAKWQTSSTAGDTFSQKLWSAMSKYEG
jgi:hypothetical protein